MRIRTFGTEIVVDLIHSTSDIGELVKLAVKLDYEAHVENAEDEHFKGLQVRMTRRREWQHWGESELTSFAILVAFVQGKSGQQVLDRMRHDLEERQFPLDRPIQDVMSIGGGPDYEDDTH